jgi:ribonuclease P/MRP protein subunit POP5
VEPAGTAIDQKELYYSISDAVSSLWGDAIAGAINQAVVAAEENHVIIRCLRGTERELAIALSTVTGCRNVRLALRPVAISGTIESLRERIHTDGSGSSAGVEYQDSTSAGQDCFFEKKTCQIHWCYGQKVDVIEKGFKNAHRLFLTRSDLENS